jgi:MoaA/NifB/PqqE/SkfB family radical SAM enzyme
MKVSHVFKSGKALTKVYLGGRVPLKISHYITYRCNLRCKFCSAWKNKTYTEMDTETINEAMDAFKKMGTVSWSISGGEPFIRKDLPEILEHAKSNGFITSVVTNGTFPDRIAEVKDSIDLLLISTEGDQKETEYYRGSGTFDRLMKTLDNVKKHGINANLNTIIKWDNRKQIELIIDQAKRSGLFCGFQPIFDYSDGREDREIIASDEKLKMFQENIDFIINEKKNGSPVLNSFSYLNYLKKYGDPESKKLKCFAGINNILLEPDGTMKMCYWDKNPVKPADWKESFKNVSRPPKGCYCWPKCHGENNLMSSMNIGTILNAMKKI